MFPCKMDHVSGLCKQDPNKPAVNDFSECILRNSEVMEKWYDNLCHPTETECNYVLLVSPGH